MKKQSENNNKYKNILLFLAYTTLISYLSIKIYLKIIKLKKYLGNKKPMLDLTIAPSPEFILPPSEIKQKNLSYCPNYTPKDKQFSEIPIKYKNGLSIIVTAYKAKNFIKETLDSISNQTYFINNTNYEILIGVDGCEETLNYLYTIMENYSNLRIFMMEENYGTYITTNTIMSIAKYNNLIRFDSDDIMLPNLIETVMKESKNENIDSIIFLMEDFGNSIKISWTYGQFLIKHWIFDYFGGFMPWICSSDAEFFARLKFILTLKKIPIILMKRRIHDNNLTVNKFTTFNSEIRKWNHQYIRSISQNVNKVNDATIIKVIGDFYEIFPKCLNENYLFLKRQKKEQSINYIF